MRTDRYKLYATGKFFDTFEDPLEKNDLAADGVPEKLTAIHAELKTALDLRVRETKVFDPIQKAKQDTDRGAEKKRK